MYECVDNSPVCLYIDTVKVVWLKEREKSLSKAIFQCPECTGTGALIYLTAVMEHLAAEALKLALNATYDKKETCIIPRHLQLAIKNDEELNKLLFGVTIGQKFIIIDVAIIFVQS